MDDIIPIKRVCSFSHSIDSQSPVSPGTYFFHATFLKIEKSVRINLNTVFLKKNYKVSGMGNRNAIKPIRLINSTLWQISCKYIYRVTKSFSL